MKAATYVFFNFLSAKDSNTAVNDSDPTVRKISQQDLDDNVKKGNAWLSIHGKVYDLSQFENQAPIREMLTVHYSGKMTLIQVSVVPMARS